MANDWYRRYNPFGEQWHPLRWVRPFMRPKTLALLESCTIGLIAGLAAVLMKWGAAWVGTQRIAIATRSPVPALALAAVGVVGCWLAGWLVQRFSPDAGGSGIPQVKAKLAFGPILLDWRAVWVKLLATTLTLGSGLTLGRQGPTVHVGASIAAQLSRWIPTSPAYRRQTIAAGAAAGLAAGFNAPIAGVLFAVEELLHDVSGLTLGPALLAAFVGAVVAQSLGGDILPVSLNLSRVATEFTARDIPAYLLLGLLAGWLGANFNRGVIASLGLYRRLQWGLPERMALAGGITGLGMAMLPPAFWNYSWLREDLVLGGTAWQGAAIAFGAHFLLTLVAFGSGAPGGLFGPSLILGAALGSVVGALVGAHSIATYALAGMGAFFAAVSRVPITAIAIVFEMAADFNLVLPLTIGSTVAYLVADRLDSGSLYDRLLALKGLESEPIPDVDLLADLTAKDVMNHPVETLRASQTLETARQRFADSHHRGFPVVDDRGNLVGILTQSDITDLDAQDLAATDRVTAAMTPQPIAVQIDDRLSDIRFLLSRYKLGRLPVLEGQRLVGIVTRSDLLRVESKRLGGEINPQQPRRPAYAIYKTRGPNTGRSRILVPIANPAAALGLLRLALAIARDRQAEVECLHVMLVPVGQSPAETSIDPALVAPMRKLFERATRAGRQWRIPIHSQICLARDPAEAILEVIQRRRIDLVIMGWQGAIARPGLPVFGDSIARLLNDAPCEIMLVKWGEDLFKRPRIRHQEAVQAMLSLDRWLVPISGGPNVERALNLLPPLLGLTRSAAVTLCQVVPKVATSEEPDFSESAAQPWTTDLLDQATARLTKTSPTSVTALALCADQVAETILHLAESLDSQVIVLGASRESLLKQVIHGNLPATIAQQFQGTILVVRGPLAGND